MTDAQKQTAGIAVTSMVLGILGMLCFGPLCSIPAVICGHMAKSKIKQNRDALSGDGMALAGLILGYVQIGLMVIMIPLWIAIMLPALAKAKGTAQVAMCVGNMNRIESAKEMVAMQHRYDDGATIPEEKLVEYLPGGLSGLTCPEAGTYTVNPLGTDPECSVHGAMSTAMQDEMGIVVPEVEPPGVEVPADAAM